MEKTTIWPSGGRVAFSADILEKVGVIYAFPWLTFYPAKDNLFFFRDSGDAKVW